MVSVGGIPVKDECAPYLGLWVNSLVGSSIFEIDLFLILPNAPHTSWVREGEDCRQYLCFKLLSAASNLFSLSKDFATSTWFVEAWFCPEMARLVCGSTEPCHKAVRDSSGRKSESTNHFCPRRWRICPLTRGSESCAMEAQFSSAGKLKGRVGYSSDTRLDL